MVRSEVDLRTAVQQQQRTIATLQALLTQAMGVLFGLQYALSEQAELPQVNLGAPNEEPANPNE